MVFLSLAATSQPSACAPPLAGCSDDKVPEERHVAVLSHAYWTSRFGRDPTVLNQPMTINGQPITIVGVAPVGFDGTTLGARPVAFVPITLRDQFQPGARISSAASSSSNCSPNRVCSLDP